MRFVFRPPWNRVKKVFTSRTKIRLFTKTSWNGQLENVSSEVTLLQTTGLRQCVCSSSALSSCVFDKNKTSAPPPHNHQLLVTLAVSNHKLEYKARMDNELVENIEISVMVKEKTLRKNDFKYCCDQWKKKKKICRITFRGIAYSPTEIIL